MKSRHIAALALFGSLCAQPALGQTRLTGMNLFGADAGGRVVSWFWTTDLTPTPHNWYHIYASRASGGSFVFGPTNGDLGLVLAPGVSDLFFTADFYMFPHPFLGVDFFFDYAVNPQISFVREMGRSTFSPIAVGTTVPSLFTDGLTGSFAPGATAFERGYTRVELVGFADAAGSDRVTGTGLGPNGDPDAEFHAQFLVTTTPEPVTMVLLGTGLLGIGAAARRRHKERDAED